MKQYHLLAAFLFVFTFAAAQNKINELVNAEKSFAALSKEQTTKAAFVTFLDSNSIVFRNGAMMNGFETWSKRKEDSSLLLWAPEFAVLSASGDFGVTAGPSEFKPSRTENARSYYGHFASLWHKNNLGKWKVLCDIGISHDSTYTVMKNVTTIMLPVNKKITKEAGRNPLEKEHSLFNTLKQNGAAMPDQIVSNKAWILLTGKHPVHGNELQKYDFTSSFTGTQFTNTGQFISPVEDLFVLYGKTKTKDKEGNYMSAWILDDNKWKLILFVVN
ncbi:MAG: hypothetical protein JWQ09_5448 [Segetibacter sp.]|nr:hypothetical protein [Segetibacter sp.]